MGKHYESAKKITNHFFSKCKERSTSAIYSRTLVSAEQLLEGKYTVDEIISVIDYVFSNPKVDVYSFGYIQACINNVLREIKKEQHKEDMKIIKKEIAASHATIKEGVREDEQAAERNRNKLLRLNAKPRFGEKSDFDMFKG